MFHVIDDEPYIREILNAMISRTGHLTQDFCSGSDYLTFMNSPEYIPPTAILTDYMMPGIDGYELIQKVRNKYPIQKIILISGTPEYLKHEHKDLCYALQKPFKMDELTALITTITDCHEHHQHNEQCPFNKDCIFKP